MNTEIVIFKVKHYSMDDNKGLSVQVLGDFIDGNNAFGIDIAEAVIPNYRELEVLRQIPCDAFPAKFSAKIGISAKKSNNQKEMAAVTLSNLKFLKSMELVDRKTS